MRGQSSTYHLQPHLGVREKENANHLGRTEEPARPLGKGSQVPDGKGAPRAEAALVCKALPCRLPGGRGGSSCREPEESDGSLSL